MTSTPEQRPGLWELRVGVWATREEADALKERVQRLLCPDPEHQGPCPIPWETALEPLREFEGQYEALEEQVRIERPGEITD